MALVCPRRGEKSRLHGMQGPGDDDGDRPGPKARPSLGGEGRVCAHDGGARSHESGRSGSAFRGTYPLVLGLVVDVVTPRYLSAICRIWVLVDCRSSRAFSSASCWVFC